MIDRLTSDAAAEYRAERSRRERLAPPRTVTPPERPNGAVVDPGWQEASLPNGRSEGASAEGVEEGKAMSPATPTSGAAPAFSDEDLALRFAERHANDLRYVAKWGQWLSWTGTYWRVDDTLAAFNLVRRMCREVATECDKPKIATAIASAKTVAAIERLAKADRRLAATIDQWDADPWLLNTPDGIVDLRTGNVVKQDPDQYCTKITAVGPGGGYPGFLAFLKQITDHDGDLEAYIQRVLGYSLTGSTREHAMFFAFGKGNNGKSVLTSTIAGILGDYHKTSPIETFIASNSDRHPTDLASLRGARFVTATETEEGRRWAEAKIKTLTGGDRVAARFMRQDFFEYAPAFKLMIAGNHKPSLRSVDEAIRRRFNLIPFNVTIPKDKRDAALPERLKAEWPGILDWMIRGCLEWQRIGLQPPPAVREATEEYLRSEDALATWLDDKCERRDGAWTPVGELFASWSAWAVAAGEQPGNQRKFKEAMEGRNFVYKRKHGGARGFEGVKLKPGYAAE